MSRRRKRQPTQPEPIQDEPLETSAEVDALGGDGEILESLPEADTLVSSEVVDAPAGDEAVEEYAAEADQLGGDGEILESLPEVEALEADDALDESSYLAYQIDQPAAEPEPEDPYASLDIEAALAAVSSLSDEQAHREAVEAVAAAAAADAERDLEPDVEIEPRPLASLKEPPSLTLRRGQLGSVIPALLLMGVGAWLTLSLTSGVTALTSPLLVFGVVGAVLVVILLAQWLASGRWTRGILFMAIFALLLVAALYEDMSAGLGMTVPLILAALGGALLLTGIIGRPPDRRLFVPGALLVAGSIVAGVVARGILPSTLLAEIAPYWWVVAVVLIVVWLLPVVFNRRS